MIPKQIFFTSGVGHHKERLDAFELALREAGIEKYNIVTVSSILPPKCKIISKAEGLKKIKPGQVIFCVLARQESNEPARLVASSIGCAIPADRNSYGYLSEHHGFGQTEKTAGKYAEKLAAWMLATKYGHKLPKQHKEHWEIKGKIVTTKSTTAASRVRKGKWTSTVAAGVFIP